uniref:Uncharacterized protein n=1 Tax=Brassica oleracea TaxID=3712 RepID=A0A3P6DTU4_BRAOL|nr:unnamed protein product [Brassica oleracea]
MGEMFHGGGCTSRSHYYADNSIHRVEKEGLLSLKEMMKNRSPSRMCTMSLE